MSIQHSSPLQNPKHNPSTNQVSALLTALRPHPTHPQPSSRSRDDKLPQNFHLHQPPPSPPPSSSSSESATRSHQMSKQPSYSFNVLRADPITSSLEHVASSTTLRPRASSTSTHPGMHGSAPVFRVAMSPSDSRPPRHRPHRAVREILPDTRERHYSRDGLTPSIPREADLPHLRSPSSTILSFPLSDHPISSTSALVTDGRRVHLRSEIPGAAIQGEGRGKKHQCPHCGKRFNRPSSMKIHVNTHTGAKRTWRCFYFITQRVRRFTTPLPPTIPFSAPPFAFRGVFMFRLGADNVLLIAYRCPYPGCGREFNVNSNMRRHWRNHSRSAPMRLPDPDVGRSGVYHPLHHPRLDPLQHHVLMSPPATDSSVSEGHSEDEGYSDEEADGYPMDVDDCDVAARLEADGDEGMDNAVRDAPGGPHVHPQPPTSLPMKGSAGSSSSSDVSVWSRSASPARGPANTSPYGHGQLHRHAHTNSSAHPSQDQQGRQPTQSHPSSQSPSQSQSHSHGHSSHGHNHGHGQIYRPSIAAYAISCTDSRVSTALRPAFTSSSSCTTRDRERDQDRYHGRSMNGGGREREKRHSTGQVYRP
ncbi:hypothetical protein JVU11DRAFT_10138 [Chiua virens]|nr:hypothetical protein JVU11DRAFT_10138 [Chiua virens]